MRPSRYKDEVFICDEWEDSVSIVIEDFYIFEDKTAIHFPCPLTLTDDKCKNQWDYRLLIYRGYPEDISICDWCGTPIPSI
ncbi:MAG: hypothetical protein ACXABY_17735, partial [Candidatus Thorarchaeota archaeon]